MSRVLCLTIALVLAASPVAANTVWYPSAIEPNLDQILDECYGMSNLVRVADQYDQTWINTGGTVSAMAGFADLTDIFGYLPGTSGMDFHELYVSPSGGGIKTSRTDYGMATIDTGPIFRFGLRAGGLTFSSRVSDNHDSDWMSLDHMITFQVVGNEGGFNNQIGNYVLAWEDRPGLRFFGSDRDFQDLMVEVSGVAPVPEPGTVILMGLGLLALGYVRFRLRFV